MYPLILALHNIMRWVVIVLAVWALIRTYMGLFGKKEFGETDRKALSFYSIGMDIQLVLGLVLYIWNQWWTITAVPFFRFEHIGAMIVAVILAHVAVVMARRAQTSPSKFRRAAIWLTLSVLVLLVAIPWPWFATGRPLLPHF